MSAQQQAIRGGIIGCGDVTEYKGAPPLYRVPAAELVAVARRDQTRAADFAARRGARRWSASAEELVADPKPEQE